MKCLRLLLMLLVLTTIAVSNCAAQSPCNDPPPPGFVLTGSACASPTPFGAAVPTPFVDGGAGFVYSTTGQIEALYGAYGNNEQIPLNGPAQQHYALATTLASQIVPLCSDGTTGGTNGCSDGGPKRIVFLVIGFSNCDVEICGGHVDAWDATRANPGPGQVPLPQLAGQACATKCPNLQNPDGVPAYNEASRFNVSDGYDQMSLLRQVYPDSNPADWLVGPSVVIFDGALGGQTLEKWDPTSIGYYATNNCDYNRTTSTDPECNYYRVADDLRTNKLSEAQVQAVFIKSGDSFPTCDLQHNFCPTSSLADAYQAELYLGDVLRYLKCCKLGPNQGVPQPRYPNLKQVFISSRTYGGYANASTNGNTCLNPEPFAFELGFTVQRAIVAQINQDANITNNDQYSGLLDYKSDATGHAPWFDWGPYLWAYGEQQRKFDLLNWCNGQGDQFCPQSQRDVLFGDLNDPIDYWGDYTHPTGQGVNKVANLLVNFIKTSPWVTPWIVF